MLSIETAKSELIQAAQSLERSGLLFRGQHANLSARTAEDRIVITRGGSIANLTKDSFAVVDIQGNVI